MTGEHPCPVCGYGLYRPPWAHDGGPSDEICPSCGIQFGLDDASDDPLVRAAVYDQWRGDWIRDGMNWWSEAQAAPPGWNPHELLRRLRSID